MKKKILFVIESLTIGGAEKSISTLLNLIDYNKYDVDLQLFVKKGPFLEYIPKSANILPEFEYCRFCSIPLSKALLGDKKMLLARLSYSIKVRIKKRSYGEDGVVFWESIKNCFTTNEKEYDVAIGYAQGPPTFYVADYVKAKKKYAWINAGYQLEGKYRDYVEQYLNMFDNVIGVSDATSEELRVEFPLVASKIKTIYDINDGDFIQRLSLADYPENNEMNFDGIKILTVGRLDERKGYDLAIDACKILVDKGYNIKWYVVGDGEIRTNLEQQIKANGLENNFILLGAKGNPYPYMRATDIYVQSSRTEGFCLTLAEARILNKPCVTTEFESIYNQIIQKKNALVVPINAKAIADGTERLINDEEFRLSLIEYLKTEKKGNKEGLEQLYMLFDK